MEMRKIKRVTSCWILVSGNRNRKLWKSAVLSKENSLCQYIPTNAVPVMLIFHLLPFSASVLKSVILCDVTKGTLRGMPLVS